MVSATPPTATGVRVRVPAKINLALKVGAPRSDGYHPLATVYQAVSLYDEVEVTWADGQRAILHDVTANQRIVVERSGHPPGC